MTQNDSEFLNLVTNKIGRINSRAMTRSYFNSIGKSSVWDKFQEDHQGISTNEAVMWVRAGYDEIPTCYCGNKAIILNRRPSNYCSQYCYLKSEVRITTLKKSLSMVNKADAAKKRKDTMIRKYGVEYNSQRDDIKYKWNKSVLGNDILSKLNSKEWIVNEYVLKNRTAVDIASELGCYYGTVIDYVRKHGISAKTRSNYSIQEMKVGEFLKSIGVEFEYGNRKEIYPLELDIYIPSHKLAIEVNGLYWHCAIHKSPGYHLDKTIQCEKQNIQLLHFWDIEILDTFEIVKSMILSKLGMTKRIYARSCNLIELSKDIGDSFFEKNHLQGRCPASNYHGLEYNGNLVACMATSSPRFIKEYDGVELIRFANVLNTTVVGGLSKLLSTIGAKSILSYANRRWSNGNSYQKNGFKLIRISSPSYFYTKDFYTVENRMKYQKHKLKTWSKHYSDDLSEAEIMRMEGYHRIYDCGNLVFEINI